VSTLQGLALRLHGPLQAWGGPVVGDDRPTLPFPSRSGVLGLLAACLGIRRRDSENLAALARGTRVHIRVDAAGTPLVDDQTIQENPNASATRQTIQSKRTYLCDASFVAIVVPGPSFSIERLATAVARPVFAPCLGRRTCVPSTPLLLGPRQAEGDIIDLFASVPRAPEPLLARLRGSKAVRESMDFYLDADDHPRRLRRLRIRDELGGPLPRMFRERFVVHVRVASARSDGDSSMDPWMSGALS